VAAVPVCRTQVRSLSSVIFDGHPDALAQARYLDCQECSAQLTRADDLLCEGVITPAQHEAQWWQVYHRTAAARGWVSERPDSRYPRPRYPAPTGGP
jgi:hypothetical protein